MRSYTIHAPSRAGLPEDELIAETRAVKEGFSWPAFFFTLIWALYHRLWFVALTILVVGVGFSWLADRLNMGPIFTFTLSLATAVVVGWSGNDLLRGGLLRRGLPQAGIVIAGSREEAVRRYFVDGLLQTGGVEGAES